MTRHAIYKVRFLAISIILSIMPCTGHSQTVIGEPMTPDSKTETGFNFRSREIGDFDLLIVPSPPAAPEGNAKPRRYAPGSVVVRQHIEDGLSQKSKVDQNLRDAWLAFNAKLSSQLATSLEDLARTTNLGTKENCRLTYRLHHTGVAYDIHIESDSAPSFLRTACRLYLSGLDPKLVQFPKGSTEDSIVISADIEHVLNSGGFGPPEPAAQK